MRTREPEPTVGEFASCSFSRVTGWSASIPNVEARRKPEFTPPEIASLMFTGFAVVRGAELAGIEMKGKFAATGSHFEGISGR